MDPFIIAAIISAIVIIILSVAFLKVSQVKPQGNLSLFRILTLLETKINTFFITAGARPKAVVQRDGGPGRVQAVRNQRARMRANGT